MEKKYELKQLNPFVREVGLQGADSWRLLTRRIYDHEIMYCFANHANLSMNGHSYTLSHGDMAIIKPDTPHSFWTDDENPGDIIWVHFDLEPMDDSDWLYTLYNTPERYAKLFSNNLHYPEHIRPQAVIGEDFRLPDLLHITSTDEAENILRTLHKAFVRKDPLFPLVSKIQLLNLLMLVFSQSKGVYNLKEENAWFVDRIKRYISTNYYKKLSMDIISSSVHLSADYCGRLFRKQTGQTVIEYLNEVRINRAKKMLLDEDLSVGQVAEMAGLKRGSYFNMVAKKHTGMTPVQLRRYMLSIIDKDN